MILTDSPIKNAYWVKPGSFLAGEYPREDDEKLSYMKVSALIEAGVSLFINLTEDIDNLKPYDYIVHEIGNKSVRIIHCPIQDFSIPYSPADTTKILDFIDAEIEKDGMVYVHCWAGVGRTGTIVGCWLARHGFRGESALKKLSELWKKCPKSVYYDSPQNDEQRNYVLKWNET